MAGTVKKYQFSEGTAVGAPTDLGIVTASNALQSYANDAAYEATNGTGTAGDAYINTTDNSIHVYTGSAWRSVVMTESAAAATKKFAHDVSGNTGGATSTLAFSDVANATHTIPAGSNTLATDATATGSVKGLVTHWSPIVASSVATVTSANGSTTTSDGYYSYRYSTSNSNRTHTLPDASTVTGKVVHVTKTDTGTGNVSFVLNGGDTFLGGFSPVLYAQADFVILRSNGAGWDIIGRPVNRYQRKFLTASVSTSTTVTDLTFSNLTVGKVYRIGGQVRLNCSAGGDINFAIHNSNDGSAQIGMIQRENNASVVGVIVTQYAVNIVFTATNTTVEVRTSVSGTASAEGDNSVNQTFLTVEECNDMVIGTSW